MISSSIQSQALLNCALLPKSGGDAITNSYREANLNVLELLLNRGADPNQLFHGNTPWQRFLYFTHASYGQSYGLFYSIPEAQLSWFGVFKLMLENGASPWTTCIINHIVPSDPQTNTFGSHMVSDVMSYLFGLNMYPELAELRRVLKEKVKTQNKRGWQSSNSRDYDAELPTKKRRLQLPAKGRRK
jgi:hypothetical protein